MSQLTRRRALGATATVLTGLVLTGFARTAGGASKPRTADPKPHEGHAGHEGPQPFSETFRGRRIEGAPSHADGHHGGYAVQIDGEELHVMQNADRTWVSVINHYETFATPRAVARAAVIELQGSELVPLA
ncbi:tyrosinase cofactor [Streptomyces sp. ISL-112]|uniref:apotyrosinase chaperone MelC1 n=1 Tax=unclassified Streptomyces TaxID=2593676 RepID=UPI001BED07E8|nr:MULTISPECIES: tyrosinase cofactor [unclassified Streptomyces]MBT2428171.1 tyrosinase cofactor [Streptomyces sp. ISL-112]MBT2463034.1 tyrosinase cofactor [Streptomyces sp. ISL-63]